MEGDIVLADEVVDLSLGVVPPILPGVGLAGVPGPLDAGRQIAHHGLEPHVEALVLPAFQRYVDAPVQVAGDGARLEVADVIAAEADHVVAPAAGLFRLVEVRLQDLREGGQVQEVMLGLAHDRSRAVDLAARVDQLGGVDQGAAVVALVAARVREAAHVTRALHHPVRQEAVLALAVELLLGLTVQVAALQQQGEDVLRDLVVVLGVGMGEQVVADPHVALGGQEALVEALEQLARGDAVFVGFDRDRGAMRVRAADHQHAVAFEAVIAGEDVGGQVGPGQVADVQVAVGVGPGDGDMDGFGHGKLL